MVPRGLVPFLTDGDPTVWDSLAICEDVADLQPDRQLWPADRTARAVARSVSAGMHSGFPALRTIWPMQFGREGLAHLTTGGVAKDIARIDAIWTDCRTRFGPEGPFSFGRLSVGDAMFAPVVSRFVTYGPVEVSDTSRAYMEAVSGTDARAKWAEGVKVEMSG